LRKQVPTLLFFQANAGNMGFRLQNLVHLHQYHSVNIFIVSYRGYGASTGKPSERGLLLDGEAAFKYLKMRDDIDPTKIVVFGRSLGGAVAVSVGAAYSHELAGVILENTFTSISDIVDHIFPWLRVFKQYILKIRWYSVQRVPAITCPMLFLAGVQDEVVPHWQMNKLYDTATNASFRQITAYPTGMHNDTWQRGGEHYVQTVTDFLAKIVPESVEVQLQLRKNLLAAAVEKAVKDEAATEQFVRGETKEPESKVETTPPVVQIAEVLESEDEQVTTPVAAAAAAAPAEAI
jgi:pimeloyl-ACP methyl ester carboxylesterase